MCSIKIVLLISLCTNEIIKNTQHINCCDAATILLSMKSNRYSILHVVSISISYANCSNMLHAETFSSTIHNAKLFSYDAYLWFYPLMLAHHNIFSHSLSSKLVAGIFTCNYWNSFLMSASDYFLLTFYFVPKFLRWQNSFLMHLLISENWVTF